MNNHFVYSRWHRLLLMLTVCVCVLGIGSSVQSQTDNEVLNTCSDIKALARQIMPGWAFQRLEALSEDECVELLGGMTYSELKSALATADYTKNWNQDEAAPGGFQGSRSEFWDRHRVNEASVHHKEGTDIHPYDGVTGAHSGSERNFKHRWQDAGQITDHLVVAMDLKHHHDHFHAATNMDWHLDTDEDDGFLYLYRNIRVYGQLQDGNMDDGWETYQITAKYEYRRCREDWICFNRWRRYTERTECHGPIHRYRGWHGECYIGR